MTTNMLPQTPPIPNEVFFALINKELETPDGPARLLALALGVLREMYLNKKTLIYDSEQEIRYRYLIERCLESENPPDSVHAVAELYSQLLE